MSNRDCSDPTAFDPRRWAGSSGPRVGEPPETRVSSCSTFPRGLLLVLLRARPASRSRRLPGSRGPRPDRPGDGAVVV